MEHLCEVLRRLNKWCLRLNIVKCLFFLLEVQVLGFIISSQGVSVDRSKLIGLADVPVPSSGKEMQAFLGFCNYFRRHVPGFASLSAPLDALRHCAEFSLSDSQNAAYKNLIEVLLDAPILSLPDFSRPFGLATDASATGLGACLLQPSSPHAVWNSHPMESNSLLLAFFSRVLSKSERSYSATHRELLAIVFGLKKCRHYLWGRRFTIFTDHRALSYLMSQRDASPLLTRWFDELMEFSFDVVHIPGVANVLPDSLSRLYPVSLRNPVSSQETASLNSLRLLPESPELLAMPTLDERSAILLEAHAFGHLGAVSITNRIKESGYYWPSLLRDAEEFVARCTTCQRFKIVKTGFHPLKSPSSNLPMFHVVMDTAGPLPTTPRGNVVLLVIICMFTRFIFLRALPNKEALTVAAALFVIFCEFGFPSLIQSDNGPEFANHVIQELARLVCADFRTTTPYNPRANGLAENGVKLSIRCIQKAIDGAQSDWDLTIPAQQFALNTRVTDFHGSAPFSVMLARSFPGFRCSVLPALSSQTDIPAPSNAYEDWLEVVAQVEAVVFPALRERRDDYNLRMANRFNKSHRLKSFAIGSYVMAKDETRVGKLSPPFEGPYKVVKRNRGGAYLLMDHDGVLLHRAYAPAQLLSIPTPSTADTDVSEVFTVNKIIAHRRHGRGYQYLVSWKGCPDSQNTWEPASHFLDINVIADYWKSVVE